MDAVLIGLIALALIGLVLVLRSRRSGDAVADFQRRIDALSPEARRGVTDRVRRLRRDDEPEGTSGDGA